MVSEGIFIHKMIQKASHSTNLSQLFESLFVPFWTFTIHFLGESPVPIHNDCDVFGHRAWFDHIITERSEKWNLSLFLEPRHAANAVLFFKSKCKKNKKIAPASRSRMLRNWTCEHARWVVYDYAWCHDKKKVERCLPPCHALTVGGESKEHFLKRKRRYDHFGSRNIVFIHGLIHNDEQQGR